VLKSGRYASGQRAAASHTGALAGQETAFDAAFKRAGIIRANTVEELFEWAYTLAASPLPKGRSMAVLTSAGGLGVAAADALEANDLHMAELAVDTQTALQAILPPAASTHNPVDMLASATPQQFASCLNLLLADPNVDGVLMIILPPPISTDMTVAEAILPIIKSSLKPVLPALVGDLLIQDDLRLFHIAQIPEFRFPERAAAALAALVKRAEFLKNEASTVISVLPVDRQAVRTLLQESDTGKFENILNAYGIPTLPIHLARTREEAVEIALQIGFPVVLKIASPDLTHKSDIGGVLLNIKGVQSVLEGFDQLVKTARAANPEASIQGVSVQCMAANGQEVILGVIQDNVFGPMVMFGSGGVEVEGMKDVAFALAPLNRSEAENMLESTWAGSKLRGYRSIPPADREVVLDTLLRLAQLASDFPEIRELEINPLRVLPVGEGVIALDVRAVSG
jgi:acetyltransferase